MTRSQTENAMPKLDRYDKLLADRTDAERYSDEGVRVWLLVRPRDDRVGAVAFQPYEMTSTDAMYAAECEVYDAWVHGLSDTERHARIAAIREPLFVENRTFWSDYGFYYDEMVTRPIVAYFLIAATESRWHKGVLTYDDLSEDGKAFYDYIQQLYPDCTLYLATAIET